MIHNLEFAYIRTEKDNKYTLFLKVDNSFLEKELDINLNNEKQLVIKTNNDTLYITKELPEDIFDSLANRQTLAVFTDSNGDFLAQQELSLMLAALPFIKKNKP